MVSEISSSINIGEVIVLPAEEKIAEEEKQLSQAPSLVESTDLEKILQTGGTKKDFQAALQQKFGKRFILSHLAEEITSSEALHTLGKIGHELTLDDLESYFAEIKIGTLSRNQIPYIRLWWATRAQDLPSYWFNYLVEQFREDKVLTQLKELKMEETIPFAYYDWLLKRSIQLGDRNHPTFSFAPRELLARIIAYTDPKEMREGMLIPIYNEQRKKYFYYQLSGQVHGIGLHAYLFTPLDKDPTLPVQLFFRGTNDLASAQRDADPNGVGKWAFQVNKEKIYDLVKNSSFIEVIGHSLGAADAQRAVALLADPKRERVIKGISLYAFCSPKLDSATIQEWKTNLHALEEANKHPIIRLHFAEHINDFVTWTGDSNLWGTESKHIYSSYLIVHSNTPIHHITKHHSVPFFKEGNFDFKTDDRAFELYESLPSIELERYLQKLEMRKKEHPWLSTIKAFFISRETIQEIEEEIEKMKQHQAQIKILEKGRVEHSWVVWIATRTVNYTLQPLVYYSLGGISHFWKKE